MDFGNLDFAVGGINPSGIIPKLFYVAKADIASWPIIEDDILAATATPLTIANMTGDFVMVSGKKFNRLYSTQGKGKITFEPTGEKDCVMYLNKANLSFPKLTDEIRAFAKASANGDYVYIIKHDGKYYVIGNPDYSVTASFSGDSGDAAGSAKGVTITLECPDLTPLPVYTGDLEISDGSIDCSTGVFTATAGA